MELYITTFMARPGDSAGMRFSEKYAKLFFLRSDYARALEILRTLEAHYE
jgi:hypothetical protein